MQDECSKNTGQACGDGMTCGPSRRSRLTSGGAILSAGDSRAPISRLPETASDLPERSLVFGMRCFGSFAFYDRGTSSWKTSQTSFIKGLVTFSEAWLRQGLMRNGNVCRQRPLVPRSAVTGCSLLPTVIAADSRSVASITAGRKRISPLSRKQAGTTLTDWLRLNTELRRLPIAFAEWMMMFPPGWTALDASETPSSRKSLNSSENKS